MLTGEEILDAGIQVVAQPPGKRNASIHLLSGGEKALTATALVFALFQLNPAPFCLLDEVDAPLDDPNTERFCRLVREMSAATQFLFISHNRIAMEMAEQLIGVTMNEPGFHASSELTCRRPCAWRRPPGAAAIPAHVEPLQSGERDVEFAANRSHRHWRFCRGIVVRLALVADQTARASRSERKT